MNQENTNEPLSKTAVMCWVSMKDEIPIKDGQYCTYLQTGKYESIGFTQFSDGEFMSSFVTHWIDITEPIKKEKTLKSFEDPKINFYCDKCKGTTQQSTLCENISCPSMPCCDKPRDKCDCLWDNEISIIS